LFTAAIVGRRASGVAGIQFAEVAQQVVDALAAIE
jgi:hypothetical protein